MQALSGWVPLMGLHWAHPPAAGRFGAAVAQQALRAQSYVAVRQAFCQHRCGVVWCGVPKALTKWQWPGCLAYG